MDFEKKNINCMLFDDGRPKTLGTQFMENVEKWWCSSSYLMIFIVNGGLIWKCEPNDCMKEVRRLF